MNELEELKKKVIDLHRFLKENNLSISYSFTQLEIKDEKTEVVCKLDGKTIDGEINNNNLVFVTNVNDCYNLNEIGEAV